MAATRYAALNDATEGKAYNDARERCWESWSAESRAHTLTQRQRHREKASES